jgi:ribosomal protein S18 acetylase RimI-like enzyme
MTLQTPMSLDVRPVPAADASRAAATLARAFHDDPVSRWMMRRDSRLAPAFDFYLRRLWLPNGEVYETADGRGVACWLPPGKAHLGFLEQMRLLPGLARILGRDLPRVMSASSLMEKDHPHERHWYLNLIGVEPSAQGLGGGSALLAHTLERCDADGLPAYLDANTERSIPLYQRHGFEVTGEMRLPRGGPTFWRMWRNGRA